VVNSQQYKDESEIKSMKEITMANQTNSTRRTASAKKSGTGLKALIMAASVALTLGGWGILAATQAQDAVASVPPASVSAQPANSTDQTQSHSDDSHIRQSERSTQPANPSRSPTNRSFGSQGQTTAPFGQPRAITRSRSSR